VLVRMATALHALGRPPDWIHLPVPASWTAPEAFAPLAAWPRSAWTRLYLGLVHLADGVEGGLRRIELARRFISGFGIATECGWGRRPPETVPALLELHAALASGA